MSKQYHNFKPLGTRKKSKINSKLLEEQNNKEQRKMK